MDQNLTRPQKWKAQIWSTLNFRPSSSGQSTRSFRRNRSPTIISKPHSTTSHNNQLPIRSSFQSNSLKPASSQQPYQRFQFQIMQDFLSKKRQLHESEESTNQKRSHNHSFSFDIDSTQSNKIFPQGGLQTQKLQMWKALQKQMKKNFKFQQKIKLLEHNNSILLSELNQGDSKVRQLHSELKEKYKKSVFENMELKNLLHDAGCRNSDLEKELSACHMKIEILQAEFRKSWSKRSNVQDSQFYSQSTQKEKQGQEQLENKSMGLFLEKIRYFEIREKQYQQEIKRLKNKIFQGRQMTIQSQDSESQKEILLQKCQFLMAELQKASLMETKYLQVIQQLKQEKINRETKEQKPQAKQFGTSMFDHVGGEKALKQLKIHELIYILKQELQARQNASTIQFTVSVTQNLEKENLRLGRVIHDLRKENDQLLIEIQNIKKIGVQEKQSYSKEKEIYQKERTSINQKKLEQAEIKISQQKSEKRTEQRKKSANQLPQKESIEPIQQQKLQSKQPSKKQELKRPDPGPEPMNNIMKMFFSS